MNITKNLKQKKKEYRHSVTLYIDNLCVYILYYINTSTEIPVTDFKATQYGMNWLVINRWHWRIYMQASY